MCQCARVHECVCVPTWSQASLQDENSAACWQQDGSADRRRRVSLDKQMKCAMFQRFTYMKNPSC